MQSDDLAAADHAAPASPEPGRCERVASALSVTAVVVAALAATFMDPGTALGPESLRLGLDARGKGAAPAACAGCGVVAAAQPLPGPPSGQGVLWQLRIRMDDGSVRVVRHQGALAAGSRVLLAGGSLRVLSRPAGQG